MFIQSIVFDKYLSEDHSNLTQDLDLSTPPHHIMAPMALVIKHHFNTLTHV